MWRLLAAATRLLTRIPVPGDAAADGPLLPRARAVFPLVGAAVAGVGVGVRAALEAPLGRPAATVAAVLTTVAVTGAFHEDGLADTADGLWGGHDPETRLRIMRDSRLGTYGVVAVVGVLALETALLAAVDLSGFARATLAAHSTGRAASAAVVCVLEPARGSGLGAAAAGDRRAAAVAALLAAAITVAAVGPWAPLVLAVAVLAAATVAAAAHRRIGGYTGDVLGATTRLVTTAVIAVVVALTRRGVVGWGV